MTRRIHKPYVVTDIEPVIAMVDAARWERETATRPRPKRLFTHDMMKQARAERSAYQRELIRRFAEFAASLFTSPRHAVAKMQSRAKP